MHLSMEHVACNINKCLAVHSADLCQLGGGLSPVTLVQTPSELGAPKAHVYCFGVRFKQEEKQMQKGDTFVNMDVCLPFEVACLL